MSEAQNEAGMKRKGREKAVQRRTRAEALGVETSIPTMHVVVGRMVGAMKEELERWVERAENGAGRQHHCLPFVKLLPIPIAAWIACTVVLNRLHQRASVAQLAKQIGTQLECEHYGRELDRLMPTGAEQGRRQIAVLRTTHQRYEAFRKYVKTHDLGIAIWPGSQKTAYGALLIEAMRMATGLIVIQNEREGRKTISTVYPSPELTEWLERSHHQLELASVSLAPMVEPPNEWKDETSGGYHDPDLARSFVINARRDLDEGLLDSLNQAVMPAVNRLQAVPWRVNSVLLDVVKECGQRGLGGLRLSTEELPPQPADPTELQSWRFRCRTIRRLNNEHHATRLEQVLTLAAASENNGKPLYFPHRVDYRGRAYPMGGWLTPQAPDLGRALLEFEQGSKPDLFWLKVHAANTFGIDKVPLRERVAWVDRNLSDFYDMAGDPTGRTGWQQASDPWQFLATVLELDSQRRNPGSISRLPVQVDGSNNGLQLYSLLTRDPEMARLTNVMPGDRPQDIYQAVADAIQLTPELEPWGPVTRTAVKRPVMTLPYGVSKHGCRQFLLDWMRETGPFIPGRNKALKQLTDALWTAMSGRMGPALELMRWLRDQVPDQAFWWQTPSGFVVTHEHLKPRFQRLRTTIGDSVRWTTHLELTDEVRVGKMRTAFAPNFVHSLDAAILVNVANRFEGPLRTIHDAFATTSDRVLDLTHALGQAVVETFRSNPIQSLRDDMALQGFQTTEPPPLGSFDPELAATSLYLYS